MCAPAPPLRVVDRAQYGWHAVGRSSGPVHYEAHPRPPLPPPTPGNPWTHERLLVERAPLRVVVPMSGEDQAELVATLAAAGRKAVATVALALSRLAGTAADRDGHGRRLFAGDPGSWESDQLRWLAWEVGRNTAEYRADPAALATVQRVVGGWVNGTDTYTEVAGNLAGVFGGVVDQAGGWGRVVDAALRRHPAEGPLRLYLAGLSLPPARSGRAVAGPTARCPS